MSINKSILTYLREYSFEVKKVNRLITSAFCLSNSLIVKKNRHLKGLLIGDKDSEEVSALMNFYHLFEENKQLFDFECLIELFEFVISPNDKIVNGAVYTPKYIREYIVLSSIKGVPNLDQKTACDIACGCGGFLYEYALKLYKETDKTFIEIIEDNLFGIDVTQYSIERTKILLTLLALSQGEDKEVIKFNLFTGDSLDFDWYKSSDFIKDKGGFNFIFSNPPYVGSSHLDSKTKDLMKKWSVSATGKLDLYIPFFEIGLKWLAENGTLGFITVNNFYRSLNGRALRSFFSANKFEFKLIDFGSEQVFKSRLTYTCICRITRAVGNLKYSNSTPQNIELLSESDFIKFEYDKLNDFNGWQLDDAKTQLNIERIENSGIKLTKYFDIKNGFATLRNNIYLFTPIKEDNEYFYFIKDGNEFPIEKKICRDAIKPNILKEENDIEAVKEKLIFPYNVMEEKNDDLFCKNSTRFVKVISEDFFEREFPYANRYLLSYKTELAKRDKGNRKYETWFAYGRSQALNISGLKLLFPYISDKPYFVYTDQEDMLFYNGYALISKSKDDLLFIQKILKSDVFWYYIKKTSKPYSSGYFSLAKNYVKNFSIPEFSKTEKKYFMKLRRKDAINKFLLKHYNLTNIKS